MSSVDKDLRKTDVAGMMYDPRTKAVINTNISAYEEIKNQRKKDKEFKKLQLEVARLRAEMNELRNLFTEKLNVKTDC
jgi:hypothetical protein